jgi:hypothetical protein
MHEIKQTFQYVEKMKIFMHNKEKCATKRVNG